jgi:hypothetical protein
LVTIKGERKPPMKWDHFYLITVPEGGSLAEKIKREFWVSVFIATHFSILHIRWTFLKQ